MNRTMITSFYRWWFSLHPGYVISSTEWMCLGSKDKRTAVLSLTAQFRQKKCGMMTAPNCRL